MQRAHLKVHVDVAVMYDKNAPRPADLLIRRFDNGKDVAVDFTFVAPLQKKYIKRAAGHKGVAVKAAEARKHRSYDEQCRQHDTVFIPVAAETYGGWGKSATDFFERVIAAEATELERPMGPVRKQFYNDLAISIARNSARAILERIPEIVVEHPLP